MFSMFDELKQSQEINHGYDSNMKYLADFSSLIMKNPFKKTFEESSRSRSVLRTHVGIYDGAFL